MGYHEDNASFMMYKEWEEYFESLDSNDERAALIMAIFAFASRNEIPDFKGALKMTFLMMSKQLDRDGTKWEKKCAKNAENVRKRWEKANADKNDGIRTYTDEYDRIRTDTNYTDKDKDKDKDNNNSHSTVRVSSSDFEKLWSMYPRKEGRKEAFAAYERAIKHGTTVETIENGIKAYCKHIEDCKIDMQYVKQGSTYFRQEAWNDDYSDKSSVPDAEKPSYDIDQFEKFAITFSGNCK